MRHLLSPVFFLLFLDEETEACDRTDFQTQVFWALFCHKFTISLNFNKNKKNEYKSKHSS